MFAFHTHTCACSYLVLLRCARGELRSQVASEHILYQVERIQVDHSYALVG